MSGLLLLAIIGVSKCTRSDIERAKQQEIEWTTGDSTFVKKQDGYYIYRREIEDHKYYLYKHKDNNPQRPHQGKTYKLIYLIGHSEDRHELFHISSLEHLMLVRSDASHFSAQPCKSAIFWQLSQSKALAGSQSSLNKALTSPRQKPCQTCRTPTSSAEHDEHCFAASRKTISRVAIHHIAIYIMLHNKEEFSQFKREKHSNHQEKSQILSFSSRI